MSPFTRLTVLTSILTLIVVKCSIEQVAAQELQIYELDEFLLDNGKVIEECVIAYRTVGELNAEGSNAVLIPTSAFGTSEEVITFGGSMLRTANVVEADMLIVVSDSDQLVSPGPSRRFADMSGTRLHEMDSDCGHLAFQNECTGEEIRPVISEFLSGEWSQH